MANLYGFVLVKIAALASARSAPSHGHEPRPQLVGSRSSSAALGRQPRRLVPLPLRRQLRADRPELAAAARRLGCREAAAPLRLPPRDRDLLRSPLLIRLPLLPPRLLLLGALRHLLSMATVAFPFA